MTCAITSCTDHAVATVRFHYGVRSFLDVPYCSRHSWPWRAGRGNGTAEVSWL